MARTCSSPARSIPECGADDACNRKNLDAEKNSKVKARIYTELLYRHWTGWQTQAPQPSAGRFRWRGGTAKDLTPGNARRAAVLAWRPRRLRHFARRPGSLLRHERRSGAGHQHQYRSLRGADRRRPDAQDYLNRRAPMSARVIRPTASTSRGARSSAPATKATAGA